MKWYFFLFFSFLLTPLSSQSAPLTYLEVVLVGPKNTDRHHAVQRKHYEEYYTILIEELDVWIAEIEKKQKYIQRKNRKRLQRGKPLKNRDIPKWNSHVKLIKGLREDKLLVEKYLKKWAVSFTHANKILTRFKSIYTDSLCFDLITPDLILSPKEYTVLPYSPKENLFEWREFFPKTLYHHSKLIKPESTKLVRKRIKGCEEPNPDDCYRSVTVVVPAEYETVQCPQGYDWNGKTCYKNFEIPTDAAIDASLIIMYLPKNIPVMLDGWRMIRCN